MPQTQTTEKSGVSLPPWSFFSELRSHPESILWDLRSTCLGLICPQALSTKYPANHRTQEAKWSGGLNNPDSTNKDPEHLDGIKAPDFWPLTFGWKNKKSWAYTWALWPQHSGGRGRRITTSSRPALAMWRVQASQDYIRLCLKSPLQKQTTDLGTAQLSNLVGDHQLKPLLTTQKTGPGQAVIYLRKRGVLGVLPTTCPASPVKN